MSKIYPITEFDSMTLPGSLQIFKALIPFMDYDMQCLVSKLIRTNELIHTMNFYKTPANCRCFKSCSSDCQISFHSSVQDILNNDNILNMIIRYCPEETENMFHQFKNFSKMSDLFSMFNPAPGNSTDSANQSASGFTMDESALLNPSQQKLYNEFIHKLDEIDLFQEKNTQRNPKTI